MDSDNNKNKLREKLREKVLGQKLKRSNQDQQRSFLGNKKVPEELMDSYLGALKNPKAPNIVSLINQMSSILPKQNTMQAPTLPTEFKIETKNELP